MTAKKLPGNNIPKEEYPKVELRHRPQGTCSWGEWRRDTQKKREELKLSLQGSGVSNKYYIRHKVIPKRPANV